MGSLRRSWSSCWSSSGLRGLRGRLLAWSGGLVWYALQPVAPPRLMPMADGGMADSDPEAVWILQGWAFMYKKAFWTQPRIRGRPVGHDDTVEDRAAGAPRVPRQAETITVASSASAPPHATCLSSDTRFLAAGR